MVLGIGLLHEPVSMEMVLSGVSDLSLILVRGVGSNVVVVWVVCVVGWPSRGRLPSKCFACSVRGRGRDGPVHDSGKPVNGRVPPAAPVIVVLPVCVPSVGSGARIRVVGVPCLWGG